MSKRYFPAWICFSGDGFCHLTPSSLAVVHPKWFAMGAFHLTAWVTLSRAGRSEWSVCFYKTCTIRNSIVWFTDRKCVGKMEQLRLGEEDQVRVPG